jgi:hypothetical protein
VTDVEEEIANIWDNSSKYGTTLNWENSSGRSAYILVYEKKLKKPLSLEFTDANLPSKEEILKNFVQEDQLNQVKEEVHENVTTVSIPYYGIKPYISKNLETEVYEDNYRFLMEQHVYSKEFLTFVTKVSVFPQLGDFNPKTLPRRILDNKIPERMKDLLGQMYRIQMSLFQTVLSRTEDNDVGLAYLVRRQVHAQHDEDHLALPRAHRRLDHSRPVPVDAFGAQFTRELP